MGDGSNHAAMVQQINGHTAWVGPAFQVVPYEPDHLRIMAIQPAQSYLGPLIEQGYAERAPQGGPAWTALVSGVPVCCAGFHEPWAGRAIAWAVLGQPGRYFRHVTVAVERSLADHPADRIESYVRVGFPAGERWAEMLGFEREARFRRFYQGADYWCFVRLKIALLCGDRQITADDTAA